MFIEDCRAVGDIEEEDWRFSYLYTTMTWQDFLSIEPFALDMLKKSLTKIGYI